MPRREVASKLQYMWGGVSNRTAGSSNGCGRLLPRRWQHLNGISLQPPSRNTSSKHARLRPTYAACTPMTGVVWMPRPENDDNLRPSRLCDFRKRATTCPTHTLCARLQDSSGPPRDPPRLSSTLTTESRSEVMRCGTGTIEWHISMKTIPTATASQRSQNRAATAIRESEIDS